MAAVHRDTHETVGAPGGSGAESVPSQPPTSGGGNGLQTAADQPPAAADAPSAPAMNSPAMRAAVALAVEQQQQSHQQQQQQHHITHEDYDWMGVLDTLEAHHDGGGVYHYHYPSPRSSPVHGGQGRPHQQQGHGTDEAQAASLAAMDPAPSLPTGEDPAHEPGGAPKSPLDTESDPTNNCSPNGTGCDEADAKKKQSRIERKRTREKQRRLDTNSQFNALADIVREIETVDFVEEARYALGQRQQQQQQQLAGKAGIILPGISQGMPPPPPSLEGKSPEEPTHAKKLKTGDDDDNDAVLDPTLGGLVPPTAPFNPSNRVDLIARTISQLSQFRSIRRRRNDELRDAKRRECELRKEMEELRRTVAHYKAVGMGVQKPQEKVMMMVPMMVPQNAVSHIAAGYPAAHPSPYASAAPQNYMPAAASPWMTVAAPHHPSTMGAAPYCPPLVGQPPAYHVASAPAAHPHQSQAMAPAPGGHVPPRNASAPPLLQPHSGHPAATTTGVPPPSNGTAPPAAAAAESRDGAAPPEAATAATGALPQPGANGQPPAPLPSYAAAAAPYHPPPPGMHVPHAMGHGHPPSHVAAAPHATMAMYPQAPSVPGGMPTVAFGLHPHPHGMTGPGQHAHASHAPGPPPPHGAMGPTTATVQQQQQPHQPPPTTGTPPTQPPSDKPPAVAPGGGGNLAHCA